MAGRSRDRARGRNPFDPLDGPVSDRLDLHGFTASEAQARLRTYLDHARRKAPGGLVHIITGKGRNSAGAPVLKQLVRTFLRSGDASQVAAWGLDDDEGGYLVRLRG